MGTRVATVLSPMKHSITSDTDHKTPSNFTHVTKVYKKATDDDEAIKAYVLGSTSISVEAAAAAEEDFSPIIKAALEAKEDAGLGDVVEKMDAFDTEAFSQATVTAAAAAAAAAVTVEALNVVNAPGMMENVAALTKPVDALEKFQGRKPRKKWTKDADLELLKLIHAAGLRESSPLSTINQVDFNSIAQQLSSGHNAKQCRDRWKNYLRGGIKKGGWTKDEEELIKDMYTTFGPKWTAMAKLITNRTDNDIKNKWYSMKRKEERQGLHEPSIYPKNLANRATAGEDSGDPTDIPDEIIKRAAEVVAVASGATPVSHAIEELPIHLEMEAVCDGGGVAAFHPRDWSMDDSAKAETEV